MKEENDLLVIDMMLVRRNQLLMRDLKRYFLMTKNDRTPDEMIHIFMFLEKQCQERYEFFSRLIHPLADAAKESAKAVELLRSRLKNPRLGWDKVPKETWSRLPRGEWEFADNERDYNRERVTA